MGISIYTEIYLGFALISDEISLLQDYQLLKQLLGTAQAGILMPIEKHYCYHGRNFIFLQVHRGPMHLLFLGDNG